jgi:VanZ family protein
MALLLALGLAGLTLYGMTANDPFSRLVWLKALDDLLLHALTFGALSPPLLVLMNRLPALGLAGLGAGFVEGVQAFVPDREPALDDLLAGLAGILVVGGVAALLSIVRRCRAVSGMVSCRRP